MQDVNRQLFSDSVIEEVMLNASVSRERALQIVGRRIESGGSGGLFTA